MTEDNTVNWQGQLEMSDDPPLAPTLEGEACPHCGSDVLNVRWETGGQFVSRPSVEAIEDRTEWWLDDVFQGFELKRVACGSCDEVLYEQSLDLDGGISILNEGYDVTEELIIREHSGDLHDLPESITDKMTLTDGRELETGDWITIVDGEVVMSGSTTHPFHVEIRPADE